MNDDRRDGVRRVSGPLARAACLLGGGLLLTGASFAAGWFAREARMGAADRTQEVRLGGYSFINPLLECEVGDRISFPDSHSMQGILESAADAAKRRGGVQAMSVYYRDLNNGPWAGVNIDEPFAPASLLKLPTVIAWLKVAEIDPRVLQARITYEGLGDANAAQAFRPASRLVPGASYSIRELMERSLVFSDNSADLLLAKHLATEQLTRAYTDLGMQTAETRTGQDIISARQYATFFRVLYNASYLQRDLSELALSMLSRAEFRLGLVAGVPAGTPVAHKFGERTFPGGLVQLHDCGIVYHPRAPYLLCVMTRGKSMADLLAEVRGVSRIVFEEIERL